MAKKLPKIDIDENEVVTADFADRLAIGETITAFSTDADVTFGADLTPDAVLDGPPQLDGTIVKQLVQPGVLGNRYKIRFKVTTSSGRKLTDAGTFHVYRA